MAKKMARKGTTKSQTELAITPPPSTAAPVAKGNVPPVLGGEETARFKHMRAAMNEREQTLFIETWARWFQDHDDYNLAEDEQDVETICYETVIQSRLRMWQMIDPRKYSERAYHESCNRMQRARENLDASRKARVEATKAKASGPVINLAVLAGQVDPATSGGTPRVVVDSKQIDKFFDRTQTTTENPMGLDGSLKQIEPSVVPPASAMPPASDDAEEN